jgi:hypothetical protein
MATPQTTTAGCDSKRINVHVLKQTPLIKKMLNQEELTLPTYFNDKIPVVGTTEPYERDETYIMKFGVAGQTSFDQLNTQGQPRRESSMPGHDACSSGCPVRMASTVVDVDPNACEGVKIVDMANGGYFQGYSDWELKLATKQRCVEQLVNEPHDIVRQILNHERRNFVQTAINSTDDHLFRMVVENGEANAVVKTIAHSEIPRLTSGGWEGEPDGHITIPWLERYSQAVMLRMKANAHLKRGQMYVCEFTLTHKAWQIAKLLDKLSRSSENGVFKGLGGNIEMDFESIKMDVRYIEKGKLAGRKFESYEGKFRIIFDEEPIRGYMKPEGVTDGGQVIYNFIRVLPLINVPAKDAENGNFLSHHDPEGLVPEANPDYYSTHVNCGGSYRLLEAIPHINSMSFKRKMLMSGPGPNGKTKVGIAWDVKMLQGDALSSKDCPDYFDGYYQYAARYRMRWINERPEYSGIILHRVAFLKSYDATDDILCIDRPRVYGKEGKINATKQNQDCFPEDEGCPCGDEDAPCDPAFTSVCLDTYGAPVDLNYLGAGHSNLYYFKVCLKGKCSGNTVSVDYEFDDDTAIIGTHYEVVDENGDANVLPTGNIEWATDEEGDVCKTICVRLIGALPDLSQNGELEKNRARFTFKLSNASNATLDINCSEANYDIVNYSEHEPAVVPSLPPEQV